MSVTIDQILSQALCLAPEARAFLAERLIESLDTAAGAEISPAWRAEILRRSHEIEAGVAELHDASDVFARAYRSLE